MCHFLTNLFYMLTHVSYKPKTKCSTLLLAICLTELNFKDLNCFSNLAGFSHALSWPTSEQLSVTHIT